MKYVVSNRCVGCGSCSGVCPMGALRPNGRQFAINAELCVGCGSCFRICPFEAIEAETGRVEYKLPGDKMQPREFPLMKNGMPHNLDGSPISMEQWLGEDPVFEQIDEVVEADVVIVGSGLAGTTAARSAAENGAKVVILEKSNGPRGRSGDIAVIGSKLEKEWWGKDNTGLKDEIIKQYMRDLGWRPNYRSFRYWLDNCGEAFDWFMDGAPKGYYVQKTTADPVPADCLTWVCPERWPLPEKWNMDDEYMITWPVTLRVTPSIAPYIWGNYRLAAATGNVKAFWNTPAKKLLRDENGNMCGVIAQNNITEKVVQVNAKSVVLATGDFAADKAMLYYYSPWSVRDGVMYMHHPENPYYINYGDGHKMAIRAGAVMEDGPIGMINHCMGGALGCAGYLNLDLNGERFMNEESNGQAWENAITKLRGCAAYQIFDSKFEESAGLMAPGHGAVCGVAPNNADYVNPQQRLAAGDSYTNLADVIAGAQMEGPMKRTVMADTLEELIDKLDMDAEAKKTALKSIERYNELCEKGVDEDFGKSAARMIPVKEGPFFASKVNSAAILCTVGGLDCDHENRVLDTERRVIPGLYVCGNIQGRRFPIEYPMTIPGFSHSSCITFGRFAGKNAAEFAKA